jgi:hypothetical protein
LATTIAPAPGRNLTLSGAVLAPPELRIAIDLIDARSGQTVRVISWGETRRDAEDRAIVCALVDDPDGDFRLADTIDRCPTCDQPLQATVLLYVDDVVVYRDGHVRDYELPWAIADAVNVDEPARVHVYCTNDHSLPGHTGSPPTSQRRARRLLAWLVRR